MLGSCMPLHAWELNAASPRLLEKFQARFDHFQELKPCFAFLANPFYINGSVMAVQLVKLWK